MSREQKELLLRIEHTMTRNELPKRRNKILHEMRMGTLANASSFLDERAKEIERLQNGPQKFKAVHLLQRRQHSKLTVRDECTADKHKVSSFIAKHFENQFQDGVGQGINRFDVG